MLRFIILCLLLTAAGTETFGQCRTGTDPKSGKPVLVGQCSRKSLEKGVFGEWFDKEYRDYRVDSASIGLLEGKWKTLDITLVMATWCSDSRREVPRFYKILDCAGYKSRRMKLICVDRSKEAGGLDLGGLEIRYVPTFIFYRNGTEIGRITESPFLSLEKDLLTLIGTGK